MKSIASIVAMVAAMAVTAALAADEAAPAAPATPPAAAAEQQAGLGMTQGAFAVILIREAKGEWLFEGDVTAARAAEKLGGLGLAPEGGWHVDRELTRADLESAYLRLTATMESVRPAAEGDAAAPAADVSKMTIAELMQKITDAVKEALRVLTRERQPMSPSRPLWR